MNIRLFILVALSCLINACSSGDDDTKKIIITGSSTIAPLINDIAQRYENLHPAIRVDVQTGGSSRGVNDTRKQLANLGMVSRPLNSNEDDIQAHTIAWDGITIILHKDNPIAQLSRQQIIDIYTGKINNWRDLGGSNLDIVVVNKSAGHSTLGLFLAYFQLKNSEIHADIIIGDNQQGLKTVAGNPQAIAYVSIGSAAVEVNHGAAIQLLPIEGISPTLDNLKQQRFPLARPLNLITLKANDNTVADQFIRYSQSNKVHDLISEHFFIPATNSSPQ